MVNSKKLSPEDIRKGQEKIKEEIYARAKVQGISTDDLWPLPDGVFNIEGYCQSSPRIMWILKQPYDDSQKDLKVWFDVLTSDCAYCMLSNSDPKNSDVNDTFFDDLYSDYNIIRVNAKRSINSKGNGRGSITEILVKNY